MKIEVTVVIRLLGEKNLTNKVKCELRLKGEMREKESIGEVTLVLLIWGSLVPTVARKRKVILYDCP